jgi:ABC-2 type transport system ATP-binding protein
MDDSKALSVTQLHKTYANGLKALDGVSLDVERGEFFALLGPNGAGKSTLIGIVCSLVNMDGGSVSVFGEDLATHPARVKSRIGLVPQEFNFNMWESPWAILLNQAGYYGIDRARAKPRAEQYLRKLGLWDKRSGRSRELSGGMKRRLMIARALVHEPALLILDEPTAGVDIELRRSMWEFLREINAGGTTIILTTHYLEEAESLCERIAIIDRGSIVEVASKKALLNKLHQETFVLDLSRPINGPWQSSYVVRIIDDTTLEADITKDQGINGLFTELSQRGIEVISMRNKANRLEELFIRMVADGYSEIDAGAGTGAAEEGVRANAEGLPR